MVFFSDSLVDF